MLIAELRTGSDSRKFLERSFVTLRKAACCTARRARRGYQLPCLRRDHVARIRASARREFAPLPCLDAAHPARCDECVDLDTCGTRLVMRTSVSRYGTLEGITLAISERSRGGARRRGLVDFSI